MARGRHKSFPEGKKETIQINVNKDFKEQTKSEIEPILKKYHLRLKENGERETESELIRRIQDESLSKCEKECLKSKKE